MNQRTDGIALARPRRFQRYSEYKDSGVEWLGQIPEHWDAKALKRGFRVVNGSTPKSGEPENWDGDIPWFTPDDLGKNIGKVLDEPARYITRKGYESCGTRMVRTGSLVLSTRAPIGHLAIAGTPLCTNQGCRSLVPRGPCGETYFYFQLHAAREVLRSAGRGSTFMELSTADLESIMLAVPPPDEQRDITAFLDRETAKIDALVATRERLIDLLQEKRTALITRAVTRGLDPNVPMKDSGVEWLGEIPAHWRVGSLSRWWTVVDCKHRTVPFFDEGVAVASIGQVRGLRIDLADANRTSLREYQLMIEGGREPQIGDIIYTRNATVGEAAIVDTEEPFCMGQDVSLIRSRGGSPLFLLHSLRSRVVLAQLEALTIGSTFKRINVDQIKRFLVPVPPRAEQEAIARYARDVHDTLRFLIERVQEALDLLNELRTALISAAVTGKIDVREARPR